MKAWLRHVALYLVLMLLGSAQAARYIVGVEDIDYRPYQAGHTGDFTGFGREALDAFAAAEGIEFDYRPLPPPRLLASLLNDRIDLKYPDDPSWAPQARAGYTLYYSQPIVGYLDGTLVKPERLGRPVSEFRVLGTVVGFTPIAWRPFLERGEVILKENADLSALMQQVLSDRVDGAYANVAVMRFQAQSLLGRPDALVFDPGLPAVRGYYRLSTLRHPELIERFDRWLAKHAEQLAELRHRLGLDLDGPG